MNRMIGILLCALLYLALPLSAQLRIGLDGLAAKASESVNVSLDSSMLQLAAQFLSADKPESAKVKKLIAGLKAIRVRSFEFSKEGQFRPADLEPLRSQLRAPGWSRIVGVDSQPDRERTEIYTKADAGHIVGLAIIATEPKELTVVEIEGTVDLSELSNLTGRFGIPSIPLPNLDKKTSK